MLLEITCPVCHFEHIPWERDTCPQCDSDLVCFKLLDALQEKKQELKQEPKQEPKQESRVDLSQESGPQVHTLPEDETWENQQNGSTAAQGRGREKFPWMWPSAAIIFLLSTVSFFGYVFHDLSEMKNMIQQHGAFLSQIIAPRGKESSVNHDRLEALFIKLGSLEDQAQKVYDLLQENGVRLNDIALMQENVLTGTGADTCKLEDTLADGGEGGLKEETLADDGELEIKVVSAGGIDAASLNVPTRDAGGIDSGAFSLSTGDAGGVMDEDDGPDHPEVLTVQDNSLETQIILNQPSPCFKIYRAKDNDTLWDISQTLYGRGIYYPVLLEHNPDLRIFDISSQDSLRYLCDKSQVSRIYKKITAMKNNRRYWKYTLRPGDTRSTVTERYCPKSKGCFVEDAFPEIGKTIGIFLE